MKHLDTDAAYRLANMFFPDDGDLALFNLVIEVMNGDLPYEVIDGPADVVEHPDTDMAATLAMATVGPVPVRINWLFDQDHAAQKAILIGLLRSLELEAKPKQLLDLERPPFTLAALVACEGADGRFAYAIFRHPALDEAQARLILANSFPADEAPDAPPKIEN